MLEGINHRGRARVTRERQKNEIPLLQISPQKAIYKFINLYYPLF